MSSELISPYLAVVYVTSLGPQGADSREFSPLAISSLRFLQSKNEPKVSKLQITSQHTNKGVGGCCQNTHPGRRLLVSTWPIGTRKRRGMPKSVKHPVRVYRRSEGVRLIRHACFRNSLFNPRSPAPGPYPAPRPGH